MGACYGWDEVEAGAGSGIAGFFAAGGSSDLGKQSLPRAPSVDDLFAPLWRLEVQHQIPEAAMAGVSNPKREELKSGAPELLHEIGKSAAPGTDNNLAPGARIKLPASPEKKIIVSTSTSDEDLNADDKKQKRMLSNRESARRSRLRKQQHLEELRSQLLELRAQNSHILGKLSVASQQFSQLNHDNQLLRLQASELGRQLQQLHREASAHHPDGLHAFGFGTSHLDPPGVAIRSPSSPPRSSSAYAIVTDVLQGSSLCC